MLNSYHYFITLAMQFFTTDKLHLIIILLTWLFFCLGIHLAKQKNARLKIPSNLLFGSQQYKKSDDSLMPVAFEPLSAVDMASVGSYGVGDQSIEAPPYSPITPRMNIVNCDDGNNDLVEVPSITPTTPLMAGEMSIEAPAFSPLTPIPIPASSVPSPMPQMSPKTRELISILEGCDDFNSDDSVQDPNYVIEGFAGTCSSDDSSNISESIITSQVIIRNELPNAELGHAMSTDCDDSVQPETSSRVDLEDAITIGEEPRQLEEELPMDEGTHGRPKKGRKRKFGQMTREERKERKYKNLSYVNYKKNEVNPKIFNDYNNCNCEKKCYDRITLQDRQAEFKKFYELGSYHAQNMYIVATVKEVPVKRRYISQSQNSSKNRAFSRQYFLKGIQVCREMFVKTIHTTPKRIDTALKKMRLDSITDKRGINGGRNKTNEESETFFKSVVEKLPTYISHYCREKVGAAKFLRSEMKFSKIYQLYTEEAAQSEGINVLSYPKAKQIFLTKFNLRTKPLNKDTCNKCDYYANKKNLITDEEAKLKIIEEHTAHLKTAENLKKQLKDDMALAKTDPKTETITYDLEKTLPLPRIPTNIVFYKRQLWVYNMGIHTGSDDQGHCNIWVEGEAGRGSQEVGSCLIKHLSERLKEGVTNLILWSDSCGGQNRNIKLTLMLKAFLTDHPTLEKIYIRFLESGHSFLPNDTDFGKIECALKYQQRVYLPEDYMNTMRTCKKNKPLQVHRMTPKDFLGAANLEKLITNRKKTVTGEKISWLKTKEILLRKEEVYSLFMRQTLKDEYEEVDLKKRQRGRQHLTLSMDKMHKLWPNGKPIAAAKLNDIKSLMHLIPKDAHAFYKNLTGDDNLEDDIDGFGAEPDFEVEFEAAV